MSYLLAFLGFSALILVHELGHFTAAKAVGMRVERFSLFFGPMVIKRTIGETEYGIGVIPLGGYVKISGMNPEEELPSAVWPRAYCNQPVWKRIVVVAAGPFVNLLVAFVIAWFILFGAPGRRPEAWPASRDRYRRGRAARDRGRRNARSRATGSSRSTASPASATAPQRVSRADRCRRRAGRRLQSRRHR